jgi:hypothetical protein
MSDISKDSDKYGDALSELRAEWDRELAVLRRPDASEKLQKAFDATPAEIAKAANAARRRKS